MMFPFAMQKYGFLRIGNKQIAKIFTFFCRFFTLFCLI